MSDIQNKSLWQKATDKVNSWVNSLVSSTGPSPITGTGISKEPIQSNNERKDQLSRANAINDAQIWNKLERLDERNQHLTWNINKGADVENSIKELTNNKIEMSKAYKGLSPEFYNRSQEYTREYVEDRISKPHGARQMAEIRNDVAAYTMGRDVAGVLKTVNQRTPDEIMAREARLEAQANARKPMAIESYRGAVKDMSTGKFDHRVDAAERVAKGYVKESLDRALLHNKIRNGGMSEEYKKAIEPKTHKMDMKL